MSTKTTKRRSKKEFTRKEIYELCYEYAYARYDVSAETLRDPYNASENTIRELFKIGIIEGVVSVEIALAMQKRSMEHAKRKAADWAEENTRKRYSEKFTSLIKQGKSMTEEWRKLEDERKYEIGEARRKVGNKAEQKTKTLYESYMAKQQVFVFPKMETRVMYFRKVLKYKISSKAFCKREYIVPKLLNRTLISAMTDCTQVEDEEVLEFREFSMQSKEDNSGVEELFKKILSIREEKKNQES